jgi:hypothetical protein
MKGESIMARKIKNTISNLPGIAVLPFWEDGDVIVIQGY